MLVAGPPEAALHNEPCVFPPREEVPREGCERKFPAQGRLWQEVISLSRESKSLPQH